MYSHKYEIADMEITTVKDILGALLFLLLIWGTSYLFLLLDTV